MDNKHDVSTYFRSCFNQDNQKKIQNLCKTIDSLNNHQIDLKYQPTQPSLGFPFMFSCPLNEEATKKQIKFLQDRTEPYIIGATSGAGKSHLLYQFAMKNYSFFLQCTKSQTEKPGSNVMGKVIEDIIKYSEKFQGLLNPLDLVEKNMKRLMHIYETALIVAKKNSWTELDFLVAHLHPQIVFRRDIFVDSWVSYESNEVTTDNIIVPYHVLLDEAQYLQQCMVGKFSSTSHEKRNSSGSTW
jgi:hypothetical protein